MECIHAKAVDFRELSVRVSAQYPTTKAMRCQRCDARGAFLCLSQGCLAAFCADEQHLRQHQRHMRGHCVAIELLNCLIVCDGCNIELVDGGGASAERRRQLLEFRRRFFPAAPSSPMTALPFRGALQFPLNYLQTALGAVLASAFLRRTLRRLYLNEAHIEAQFGVEIAPRFITALGRFVFGAKGGAADAAFLAFYELLAVKEPRLSGYGLLAFEDYFRLLIDLLHRKSGFYRPIGDTALHSALEADVVEESSLVDVAFGGALATPVACERCEELGERSLPFSLLSLPSIARGTEAQVLAARTEWAMPPPREAATSGRLFGLFGRDELQRVTIRDCLERKLSPDGLGSCAECGGRLRGLGPARVTRWPATLAVGFRRPDEPEKYFPLYIEQSIDLSFLANEAPRYTCSTPSLPPSLGALSARSSVALHQLRGGRHGRTTRQRMSIYGNKTLVARKPINFVGPPRRASVSGNVFSGKSAPPHDEPIQSSHSYFLYCCVVQREEVGRLPRCVLYLRRKVGWTRFDGQNAETSSRFALADGDETPVMLFYKRERRAAGFGRIAEALSAARKAEHSDKRLSTIPSHAIASLLDAPDNRGYSLAAFLCSHGRLRPSFEQVFERARRVAAPENPPTKRPNREIEQLGAKGAAPQFGALKFLLEGEEVPQEIVPLLEESLGRSTTSLLAFEYSEECRLCTTTAKEVALQRMSEKTLVAALLAEEAPTPYLIFLDWLRDYFRFLLADCSVDRLKRASRFDLHFTGGRLNAGARQRLVALRSAYDSDEDIFRGEFVAVSSRLFAFLAERYGWECAVEYCEGELFVNAVYQPPMAIFVAGEQQTLYEWLGRSRHAPSVASPQTFAAAHRLTDRLSWLLLAHFEARCPALVPPEMLVLPHFRPKLRRKLLSLLSVGAKMNACAALLALLDPAREATSPRRSLGTAGRISSDFEGLRAIAEALGDRMTAATGESPIFSSAAVSAEAFDESTAAPFSPLGRAAEVAREAPVNAVEEDLEVSDDCAATEPTGEGSPGTTSWRGSPKSMFCRGDNKAFDNESEGEPTPSSHAELIESVAESAERPRNVASLLSAGQFGDSVREAALSAAPPPKANAAPCFYLMIRKAEPPASVAPINLASNEFSGETRVADSERFSNSVEKRFAPNEKENGISVS